MSDPERLTSLLIFKWIYVCSVKMRFLQKGV